MTPPPTVLVTSRSFSSGDLDARGALESAGARVITGPAHHAVDALRPLLAHATAWIAGTGPITADHLDAAPHLRLIARYGVGVDAVDFAAAARRSILVTNTPGANSGAVADHALALMLAALRNVTRGDQRVRAGDWSVNRARELGRLTVGIIGAGRIGRGVAARLAGFGSTVLGHDPWVLDSDLRAAGIEPASLNGIADRCDIVSLHAPGEQPLIDAAWLAAARPGLILVNTARAGLVDEAALAKALDEGKVRVYASDTLSSEAGEATSPLLTEALADRTIFTPHSAAQTVEAVDSMSLGTVSAVLAVLRGDAPANIVPLPSSKAATEDATKEKI
ncbi:NAD(P)-dependent oxidoreductase [Streptomyces inhibens]|uniref:NAD(P)-dependent oxidoreductase n=1 Tax=Streptomyces inhibens TaxID=2293571 RepID=UPI001EE739DA|nr:NAD(P)-dependent oxidoreductase [Streptomyces inhibens]UKY54177.1 hydroxyacid dehydrogenase [Streptomyces inhibens]